MVQRYGVMPEGSRCSSARPSITGNPTRARRTIIGAVGAGGIGLKLWEAMRTNTNWANVFYMVLLILLVVFIFDNISNYPPPQTEADDP